MSLYSDFFLNSKSRVVQLEMLEISHPSFSKVYYIVRNATLGITVRHENGVNRKYQYYPCKIEQNSDSDDLDQGFKISVGDLGELIPDEVDRVNAANTAAVKPKVVYRSYRSDDLLNVMYGPLVLEVKAFSFTPDGASFQANAPQLNINSCGEIYDLVRFDPLRGTL